MCKLGIYTFNVHVPRIWVEPPTISYPYFMKCFENAETMHLSSLHLNWMTRFVLGREHGYLGARVTFFAKQSITLKLIVKKCMCVVHMTHHIAF